MSGFFRVLFSQEFDEVEVLAWRVWGEEVEELLLVEVERLPCHQTDVVREELGGFGT
jgi:hypothetical protein